jgi:hypothetical protein
MVGMESDLEAIIVLVEGGVMDFLSVMKTGKVSLEDLTTKTLGELITKATDGKLLVDGKPTYELAHEKKHDIDVMYRCCISEIEKYRVIGQAPAPFFFERVAILARKVKNYDLEVEICEKYINLMNEVYGEDKKGIKAGPRYASIEGRLSKAKELQAKAK